MEKISVRKIEEIGTTINFQNLLKDTKNLFLPLAIQLAVAIGPAVFSFLILGLSIHYGLSSFIF